MTVLSRTTPSEADAPRTDAAARPGRVGAAVGWLVGHPVALTALVGLVFTIVQLWWVSEVRHLGAFNVDEEGGLATALRIHRSLDPVDYRPLYGAVYGTWNGPLVPLLAVPGLIVGTRGPTSIIAVQPLLVVLASCAVAATVAHLGNRRAALVAGIVTMFLPISVISSRSMQYSTGVAAFIAVAAWALITSDRCRKQGRMIILGAAVGGMILSRTMAVGFVPGVVLAGLVVMAWERQALVNIAKSILALLVVAGTWWAKNVDEIADYIYVNAYGDRAHFWGAVPYDQRFEDHLRFFEADFRVLMAAGALALATCLVGVVEARVRGRRPGPWIRANREVIGLWLIVAMGFISLMSTANVGFWFAHPLDVVLVAAVAGLVVRAPAPTLAGLRRLPTLTGVAAVALAVACFALSLSFNGAVGSTSYSPWWQRVFVSTHTTLQGGNIEADRRMASTSPAVRERAAAEWWEASVALAEEVDRLQRAHGVTTQSIIGEIHLFNANTISLTAEVTNRGIAGIDVVNTLEPPDAELRQSLTPNFATTVRVLVVIQGRSLGFPDGRGWRRFADLAEDGGWQPVKRIPLPDGGVVVVQTHPASIPGT